MRRRTRLARWRRRRGHAFPDEIGELSVEIRPQRLRLWSERESERVGKARPRRANGFSSPGVERKSAGLRRRAPPRLPRTVDRGSLRELRKGIERALIPAAGETIERADLSGQLGVRADPAPVVGARVARAARETEPIRRILARERTLEEAARICGIDPATRCRQRQKPGLPGGRRRDAPHVTRPRSAAAPADSGRHGRRCAPGGTRAGRSALARSGQPLPRDDRAAADAALRTGGAGSRRDRQDDATALFRVREAIETRTCRHATGRVWLTALAGAVVRSFWVARRWASSRRGPIEARTAPRGRWAKAILTAPGRSSPATSAGRSRGR